MAGRDSTALEILTRRTPKRPAAELPKPKAPRPPLRERVRGLLASPYALTIFFFALCLARTLAHVMWRDELQAWMIARESHSLAELFNARYEGHPALWFLVLYALSRVSENPMMMQLLQVLGATGVVWVVARYAPFRPLLKWLFALGYFPFFEYGVVSRTYALGALLFFIACAMMTSPRRKDDRVPLACVLFMLCQTTAFGILLAAALAATYAFEVILDRARGRVLRPIRPAATALAAVIFVAGMALAVRQMLPPADNSIVASNKPHHPTDRLEQVLAGVWAGYIPLRLPESSRWKTRDELFQIAQALAAVPIFALAMLLVWRSPSAAFLLLCGTAEQLLFKYQFHPGATRHHGHLFILFVGAYWLRNAHVIRAAPGVTAATGIRQAIDWIDHHRNALVAGLLGVHAMAGLAAGALDVARPFSASKVTARYLAAHFPADAVIVGDDDVMTSPVAAYLNRPLYYPARGEFGSYIKWDAHRKENVSRLELFAHVKRLRSMNTRGVPIVLVLTYSFRNPVDGVKLIEHFDRSTRPEERYFVYRVTGDPEFAAEDAPPATSPAVAPLP